MLPNALTPCSTSSSAAALRANRRLVGVRTALLAAFASLAPSTHAAALTWDTTIAADATITAGNGTWTNGQGNWNSGATSSGVNWSNITPDTAIFAGTVGTHVVTVGGSISSGSLTFNTSGYTLSAASAQTITSTGNTNLASGVTATIGSNATVTRATSDLITTVSGSGGTLNIGSADQSSSGAQYINTQSGSTGTRTMSITAGTSVNVNAGGYFGQSSATSYVTSTNPNGTAIIVGNTAAGGSLVVKAGGTVTNGNNQAFIIGGLATGSGNLTIDSGQVNAGTVTIGTNGSLPAASAYAGLRFGSSTMTSGTRVVNLNGGNLTVGQIYASSATAGTSTNTFNFNGGTLKAGISNPTFMASGVVTTANVRTGGAKIDTNNFDITIGQALVHESGLATADGGLTKSNAGTLTLSSSANTYNGTTTINGGTLSLGTTGTINASSGIAINGSGAKFLQTNTTTAVTPSVTVTQGTLTGSGTVNTVTVGAGTGGIISNNNGVAGAALTIGTLSFGGAATVNTFNNSTSAAIVTTGALSTSGAGSVTINPTAATWANGTNYNLVSFGSLTGSGFSAFTLGTVGGISGRQSAALSNSGSALQLLFTGDTPYWTGDGDGKWNLASTNNWKLLTAGTSTTFLAADVSLFNDNATGAGPLSVAIDTANVAPSSTTFDNTTKDYALSGAFGISSGTLTKSGTGNLSISTANTYSGATAINGGTVTLSGSGTVGTGSALTLGGGKLDLGGTSQSVGAVSLITAAASGDTIGSGNLTGTSYAVSNAAGDVGISANLLANGAAGLAKTGNGSVTLSGANTYTGATGINGGTVTISGSGTLGTGSALTLGGGKLDLGGTSQSVGAVSLTTAAASGDTIGNGSLTGTSYAASNVASTATISANLLANGAAGFAKTGNGTVILSGNNTYTGTTTIGAGGVLNIQHANALGSTAGATSVPNNATLQLQGGVVFAPETLNLLSNSASFVVLQNVSGNNEWTGTIASSSVSAANFINIGAESGTLTLSGGMSSGGAPFAFRGNGTILVTGQITGATGVISAAGEGIRTLSNNSNSYTGLSTVGSGTLSFGSIKSADGTASALGAPVNATNGTIAIGSGNATGTLVYTGTGDTTDRVLNLAGTTGGATIDQSGTSGTLKFTSDLTATGTGDKILTLQGSTAGTGEIAGAIVNSTGFTTSLTKNGTGTWTLSGTNTYTGATTVSQGTLIVSGSIASSVTTIAPGAVLSFTGSSSAGNITIGAGATFALGTAGTAGAVTINDGTFSGAGTVGSLTFTGASVFGPGNSPGTVTIADGGTLTMSSDTVSNFEITSAAFTAGTYDLVTKTVAGGGSESVVFDGTLNLIFSGGPYSVSATAVKIFDVDAYSGNFSSVVVSGLDIGLVATFNSSTGYVAIAAIPEPSAFAAFAGVGMIGFVVYRRRRQEKTKHAA